jgi:hypothetical protein
MNDILDDLSDLYKQATTEQSHYYTANIVARAMIEIAMLRAERDSCEWWIGKGCPKQRKAKP